MTDRLITRAWWVTTMILIALTGSGAMLTAYRGVFNTFEKSYLQGATNLLASLALAIACYLLCRHRNDLVGV